MANLEANKISPEISEIIEGKPSWIVNWGIVMISLILFSLFLLTSLVKFPETIKCAVIIIEKANESNILFAEAKVSREIITKIKVGQKALINIDNLPKGENGTLNSKVSSIPDKSLNDSIFFVELRIENIVDAKNNVSFSQLKNMKGEANIIVEQSTLFNKIVEKIRTSL